MANAEMVNAAFDEARAEEALGPLDVARLVPTADPAAISRKAHDIGTLEVIGAAAVDDGAKLAEPEFWSRLILIGFLAGYQIGRKTAD